MAEDDVQHDVGDPAPAVAEGAPGPAADRDLREPAPVELVTPTSGSGSFDAIAPIIVFVVLNRVSGLQAAVVGATLWSLKVLITRHRRGLPIGRFMPLITAAVIGRGLIGVVTDSETVYFGLGIATKYGVALVLAASVLVRRPLAAAALAAVLPVTTTTASHPRFRSTMNIVTLIGAAYYLLSASFDIWLYRRSSVEGYVIIRFLVNWPLSLTAVLAIVLVLRQRLRDVPGLSALHELLGQRPSDA